MERSDADFYHIFMPHDTDGKNRYKAENNGKFHPFSSGWKNGENHLFPSRWKFGPYQQKNGGGITMTAAALYPACFFFRGPLGLEVGLRFTPLRK